MAQYSTAYRTPFDANNAIGRGSNPRDDDFRQTSPQLKVNGLAVPGFVALESKWKKWDPFSIVSFAAVDPVRQMAMLRTVGNGVPSAKAWAGYVQAMPLPALPAFAASVGGAPPPPVSAAIEYTVYQRLVVGDVQQSGAFDDASIALVLGEDLIDAPDTSQIVTAGLVMTRASGGLGTMETLSVPAMSFVAVGDGIPYWRFRSVSGLETGIYVRARIRTYVERATAEADPVWQTTVHCDYSQAGDGWLRMSSQELTIPIRHAGFAVQSTDGFSVTSYTDLFRVDVAQGVDDVARAVGGGLSLGSV